MFHKEKIIITMLLFWGFRIFNNLGIKQILHFDFLSQIVLKHSKNVHTNNFLYKIKKNTHTFTQRLHKMNSNAL